MQQQMKGSDTERSIVRHYRNQRRRQSLLLIVYNVILSVGVIKKNPEEQKYKKNFKNHNNKEIQEREN